ncbi:tape measure protein [Pseudomonas sp. D1-3]
MAGKVTTQLVIEGKNNSKAAFDQVNRQLDDMSSKLATAGRALVAAFSVSALTGAIRAVGEAADNYNLMNARLKLATGSQEEFNTAQTELRRIAVSTQTPLSSLATLYGRISRPLREAGRSQADILKVTEAVATSFRVSGASAQEAENGVIQFAQALGAGALRGDEFNSVAEQAPRLMQALADSLNVPIGSLKEMAAQGLLTADVVTTALVDQLDTLRAEAQTLPETVGGAMTALSDSINQAIGSADLQPLIDGINELNKVVQDPSTIEGLASLSGALTRIGASAVGSAADLGLIGQQIGLWGAQLAGAATEIDRVDHEIKELEKVRSKSGLFDVFASAFFDDGELDAQIAELKRYRQQIVEQQSGLNLELQFLAEVGKAVQEQVREQDINSRTQYVSRVKGIQADYIKAADTASKELVAAERRATTELGRVREERLGIEKRYSTVLATLGRGHGGNFGDAQDLKAAANRALSSGDVEAAKANAQAAVQILQQLASAGESTYGFEGFIKELRGIELAANDIENTRAEEKVKAIQQSMRDLKAEADKLKDMPVSVKSDDASLEAIRGQIQSLVEQLNKTEIVLPVRLATPQGTDANGWYTLQDPGPVPGFAKGTQAAPPGYAWVGEKGPELVNFRGGEQVLTAAASRNLASTMAGISLGLGGTAALTEAAMSAPAKPSFPNLGRMVLEGGGEQVQIYVAPEQGPNLQRLAMKHGRTTRR